MLILAILMIFKVSADVLLDFYKSIEHLDAIATIDKLHTAVEAEREKLKERSPGELDHLVKNIEKMFKVDLKNIEKKITTKEDMMKLKKLRAVMKKTREDALKLLGRPITLEELDYSVDETQKTKINRFDYKNLLIGLFIFLIVIIFLWRMLAKIRK